MNVDIALGEDPDLFHSDMMVYTISRLLKGPAAQFRLLADVGVSHGESPLWVRKSAQLLIVDSHAGIVLSVAGGDVVRFHLPEPCFWIVASGTQDEYIAGFRRRIVRLWLRRDQPVEVVREMFALPAHIQGVRFNDAKVAPDGALFTGTMDEAGVMPTGALYRLQGDRVTEVDEGYTIPNGPAFSPCGAILYQADSALGLVYAYQLAADGGLNERRVHLRFATRQGSPDGMCCDIEGGLWVAHWGGGRITRFHQDGTQDRSIRLPARNPTSLAFIGHDLRRLAVTTAMYGRRWNRTGGAIYEADSDIAGLRTNEFS